MQSRFDVIVMFLAGMIMVGCERQQPEAPPPLQVPLLSTAPFDTSSGQLDGQQMIALAQASVEQARVEAKWLLRSTTAFLQAPSASSLVDAQQSWQQAYSAFLHFRVFGYLPITDPVEWRKQRIDAASTWLLLDSWPITGGYIDHVPGYPRSGIVNDLTLEISPPVLLRQHGFSSEYDVSLGFHALDFLLRGGEQARQWHDFALRERTKPVASDEPPQSDSDHHESVAGVTHQDRRRDYLAISTGLLLTHIERLHRRWQSQGLYATTLANSDNMRLLAATRMALQNFLQREVLERRVDNPAWWTLRPEQRQAELIALYRGTEMLAAALVSVMPALEEWPEILSRSRASSANDGSSAQQQERERVSALLSLLEPVTSTL